MSTSGKIPTTHWSLVVEAGGSAGSSKRRALTTLLGQYTPVLRAHLIYSKRLSIDRAEDFVQSFVADKVLEQDLFRLAKQGRGRFRGFLLTALDRFVSNKLRGERAKKRSPRIMMPIEDAGVVTDGGASPAESFDMSWAREVLVQAVDLMRNECAASRPQLWEIFEARVLLPALEGTAPISYSELVRRFGFATPSQAANSLVTANRMFNRMLRCVVGRYEKEADEIDEEIRDLRQALTLRASGK